jgi:hypothetical protein
VARAAVLGNVERNSTTFVFIRLAEQHDVAPLGEADDLGDLGGPRGSGGAGDDELPKNGGQKGGGHQEAPLDQVAAAELVIPFQVQVHFIFFARNFVKIMCLFYLNFLCFL